MKKIEYENLAEKISKIHILIFLLTVSAMILIFVYEPLKIYSAIWLASLWLIELVFGFQCPLTVEEYNFRRMAGEHIKSKRFIPTFLKRYFKVNFPDWLAETWLTLYFIVSIYILSKYLV